MKAYKLEVLDSNSSIVHSLCAQLAEGKSGEVLIRNGFSQFNFGLFAARFSIAAVKAGYDDAKIAQAFKQLAICNASQACKACECIMISFDGEKAKDLTSHWGISAGGSSKPDLSLIAGV